MAEGFFVVCGFCPYLLAKVGGWVVAELLIEAGYFLFEGVEGLVIPFAARFLSPRGVPFFGTEQLVGFLEGGVVRDYVVYVCVGASESGLQELELELEVGFLEAEFELILGFGGPVEPQQGGWIGVGLGFLVRVWWRLSSVTNTEWSERMELCCPIWKLRTRAVRDGEVAQ